MNKVQFLIEKYKDSFSEQFILKLINFDKTPTKKYSEFILSTINFFFENNHFTDKIIGFLESIEEFDSLLPYIENKDIYSVEYRNPANYFSVLSDAREKKFNKISLKRNSKDTFILDETKSYILFEPRTEAAAQKYGYGTKWCTSSNHSINRFYQYKNKLLYLISKDSQFIDHSVKKLGITNNGHGIEIYNVNDKNANFNILELDGWKKSDIIRIKRKCKKFFNRDKFWFIKKHFKNSIRNRRNKFILENLTHQIPTSIDK